MEIVSRLEELRQYRRAWHGEVAFVPTMGNLHDGHLQLVKEAKLLAQKVVVSIFVNPLQFGENEDFSTYPRTLDADIEKLKALNIDLLFTPNVETIYSEGMKQHTQVVVPEITNTLCGSSRPGHFDGVSTVVCKLFNMVQPSIAIFGKKDYQQLAVIRKMVSDLALPIEIIGSETKRETDGLAMSSRNGYLSEASRKHAPLLQQLLIKTKKEIEAGNKDFFGLSEFLKNEIEKSEFKLDYFSICRQSDLQEVHMATTTDNKLVLLIAAVLGQTRLIDNVEIEL